MRTFDHPNYLTRLIGVIGQKREAVSSFLGSAPGMNRVDNAALAKNHGNARVGAWPGVTLCQPCNTSNAGPTTFNHPISSGD